MLRNPKRDSTAFCAFCLVLSIVCEEMVVLQGAVGNFATRALKQAGEVCLPEALPPVLKRVAGWRRGWRECVSEWSGEVEK